MEIFSVQQAYHCLKPYLETFARKIQTEKVKSKWGVWNPLNRWLVTNFFRLGNSICSDFLPNPPTFIFNSIVDQNPIFYCLHFLSSRRFRVDEKLMITFSVGTENVALVSSVCKFTAFRTIVFFRVLISFWKMFSKGVDQLLLEGFLKHKMTLKTLTSLPRSR